MPDGKAVATYSAPRCGYPTSRRGRPCQMKGHSRYGWRCAQHAGQSRTPE